MITRPPRQSERSFILFAVMIVVMSALLIATSILFLAQADLAGQADAGERTQSRLLAWSGVQVVMNRLDVQRDRILEGETPEIDEEFVLYETGDRRGVVRLLSVNAAGDFLGPEAAKIDLNAATAEMLQATELVDEQQARAIINYRDRTLRGTYQTVGELLGVPGLEPEDVYGPIEELTVMDEALGLERDIVERVADRLSDTAPRGLADLVTVYGFEPALQRSGRLRINLNVPWSDELGERVEERFGADAAAGLKQVFASGTTFPSDAKIFQVLRFFNVEPTDWPDAIDALTADEGEYHFGRLDINSASSEALQTLPGIEPEQAAQIVRARDALSADDRATVAWPAIEEIVEPVAYDELAGLITTRSWTYRVRLAAGEVDVNAADFGGDADRLLNPVIYEVVIDLSAPDTRVAYMREITYLQTAALLAVHMPATYAMDDEDAEDAFTRDERLDSADPDDEADADPADPDSTDGEPADGETSETASSADGPLADDEMAAGTSTSSSSSSLFPSSPRSPGPSSAPGRRRVGRWQSGR